MIPTFTIAILFKSYSKFLLQLVTKNNVENWFDFVILFNRYLVFLARVTLAAMDHNMRMFRPHARTADGKFKYARKYSKRTKKWHAEPVKVDKEYKYLPFLLSSVLKRRHDDKGSVRRVVTKPANHPKHLAPSVAMKQPTDTEELVKFRLARHGPDMAQKKEMSM